jgi:hypothetical protein
MDPNLFYEFDRVQPAKPVPEECREACRGCPVRASCLEEALLHEGWGFAGNTTASERRAIRKKLGIRLVQMEGVSIFRVTDKLIGGSHVRAEEIVYLYVQERLFEMVS